MTQQKDKNKQHNKDSTPDIKHPKSPVMLKMTRNRFLNNPCLQTARPYFAFAVYNGIDISPSSHKELFDIISKQILKEHLRYAKRRQKELEKNAKAYRPYKYINYAFQKDKISDAFRMWRKDTGASMQEQYGTFYDRLHKELIRAGNSILSFRDDEDKKHFLGGANSANELTPENLIKYLKPSWNQENGEFREIAEYRALMIKKIQEMSEEMKQEHPEISDPFKNILKKI